MNKLETISMMLDCESNNIEECLMDVLCAVDNLHEIKKENEACIKESLDIYKELKTICSFQQTYIKLLENMAGYKENNEPERSDKEPNIKNSFVYIMQSNDIYKIGITTNLNNRVKSLKTGNPDIKVIASMRTCKARYIESKLHNLLKEKNYKNEWFKLEDVELEMIIRFFNFNKHIDIFEGE